MILARVLGNVVATKKHPSYTGHKTLIVQPVDEYGNDTGTSFVACDSVQAGPGDVVLVEQEGNCARQILGTLKDPFHSVICGIVDRVKLEG
ncbi:MAG: EutN/CcmL family microcompartment protein [Deltaproteobacteria bacterium]|nr:EutN/CcmL family microcompartment protein [Deltaproteobacteria bacterium]